MDAVRVIKDIRRGLTQLSSSADIKVLLGHGAEKRDQARQFSKVKSASVRHYDKISAELENINGVYVSSIARVEEGDLERFSAKYDVIIICSCYGTMRKAFYDAYELSNLTCDWNEN
jgi:vacuolar-type H+-ATPase subunit D/Vma8